MLTSTAMSRPCFSRGRMVVRASGGSNGAGAFTEGQKVKVIKPVKVYHIPKHADGVDIEGFVGEVTKNATQFKGKVLSANFPFVVKFQTEVKGTPAKFLVHLGDDEIAPA